MTTANDELKHPAEAHINWNESYYFNFFDHQRELAGFFRIGLEENKQQSNMWCSFLHKGKVIYQRFRLNLPYTDSGLEDLTVGGLRFRLVEALKTINISFSDRHLQCDLQWQGFHDVFDMREEMTEMADTVANGHYEQSGNVTGRLSVGDAVFDIQGQGFRDHSWGVRDWEGIKIWKTCLGQFGNDFAFTAGEVTSINGKTAYLGFIYDAGKSVSLRKATVDLDDDTEPTVGTVILEEHNGAKTRIDLEFMQVCRMPYDFNVLQECYVKVRRGEEMVYGIVEVNRRLL